MFWILRRTGAVNLFNSINNNYSSKSGSNFHSVSEKHNARPPRKAYGRLSMDADEQSNMKCGGGGSTGGSDIDDDDSLNDYTSSNNSMKNLKYNNKNNSGSSSNNSKNCINSNLYEIDNNNHQSESNHQDLNYNIMDNTSKNGINTTLLDNNNTALRLQTITLSDDDDFDESLTCNVCDRAFQCHRQLASHQQKKRHFGCSGCDSLFPSLMLLEHHKEEFEHWSDTEDNHRIPCCRRNRRLEDDDDFYNSDTATSDAESEDMERLL